MGKGGAMAGSLVALALTAGCSNHMGNHMMDGMGMTIPNVIEFPPSGGTFETSMAPISIRRTTSSRSRWRRKRRI
jgi:hypothetical protein